MIWSTMMHLGQEYGYVHRMNMLRCTDMYTRGDDDGQLDDVVVVGL